MTPHTDAITEAAAAYHGVPYERQVCTVHVARVLRDVGVLQLTEAAWAALNIHDHRFPWSPPFEARRQLPGAVLVDHLGRVAGEVGPQLPTTGRWHLCQGWQTLSGLDGTVDVTTDRGHCFLWYATSPTEGFTVESQPGSGPTTWGPGLWATRTRIYRAGVAWCVLPELPAREVS